MTEVPFGLLAVSLAAMAVVSIQFCAFCEDYHVRRPEFRVRRRCEVVLDDLTWNVNRATVR